MALYFRVTDAGLAAATDAASFGLRLALTRFKLGSSYGYSPTGSETALSGTIVYDEPISAYKNMPDGSIIFVCSVLPSAGPFTFGEIGLYTDADILFAVATFPDPQDKYVSGGSSVNSTFTFNCHMNLSQRATQFNLSAVTTPAAEIYMSWDQVVPLASMPDPRVLRIVINQPDSRGDLPTLSAKPGGGWSIDGVMAPLLSTAVVNSTYFYVDISADSWIGAVPGSLAATVAGTNVTTLVVQTGTNTFRLATAAVVGGAVRLTYTVALAALATGTVRLYSNDQQLKNTESFLEQAVTGVATIAIPSGVTNYVLGYPKSATGAQVESRASTLVFSTASADFNVLAPPGVSKSYTIVNNSTRSAFLYNSTVLGGTTTSQPPLIIAGGVSTNVRTDGSRFYLQTTGLVTTTGDQTIGGNKTFTGVAVFDSSVGIGITPSTSWPGEALELGNALQFGTREASTNLQNFHARNAYLDANTQWRYKTTDTSGASLYAQTGQGHAWFTATSGTAGSPISFLQGLTLNQNGCLIAGALQASAYSGVAPRAEIYNNNSSTSDTDGGTLALYGTSNTAGAGAALALGSLFNSTGGYATFARIRAVKTSGNSSDHSGGLAFDTRVNGQGFKQQAFIDENGNFLVGGTNKDNRSSGFFAGVSEGQTPNRVCNFLVAGQTSVAYNGQFRWYTSGGHGSAFKEQFKLTLRAKDDSGLGESGDLVTFWGNGTAQTSADLVANGVHAGRGGSTIPTNTRFGTDALAVNTTGAGNTASGNYALRYNTTGSANTATGSTALYLNTTGYNNTANGNGALYYNTTGSDNTANGVGALYSNTSGGTTNGNRNTANGVSALYSNTTGSDNTAIGVNALYFSTTGIENTASGMNALRSNTVGNYNTANGVDALRSNANASQNTANGCYALRENAGNYNTASGMNALRFNTQGYLNTACGWSALYFSTTGNQNTAIGGQALYNSTGSDNTAIGVNAGFNLNAGSNNTFVGYASSPSATNSSNQVVLGNSSVTVLRCQVQTITALSDRRDKKDIESLPSVMPLIRRLRPVSFVWNARDNSKLGIPEMGFIAQEVQEAQIASGIEVPNLVHDLNPERLELGSGTLIPVLTKVVQELIEEVEKLKLEVETLKLQIQ